ncbi:DUF3265 domain-containing protein [Vibrio sp. Hal054]
MDINNTGVTKNITRRSSGIYAAWHFWYAVILVVKVICGSLVYAAFTPQLGVSYLSHEV